MLSGRGEQLQLLALDVPAPTQRAWRAAVPRPSAVRELRRV
jgi:hypothetical protein